ncbi:HD domain-containing protein, partial [Desulfurobacterium sp.]
KKVSDFGQEKNLGGEKKKPGGKATPPTTQPGRFEEKDEAERWRSLKQAGKEERKTVSATEFIDKVEKEKELLAAGSEKQEQEPVRERTFEDYISEVRKEIDLIVSQNFPDEAERLKSVLDTIEPEVLLPFVRIILEAYAKKPLLNSLGYTVGESPSTVEAALSKVPLVTHVLDVVEKLQPKLEKLAPIQRRQLLLAALGHDVGKVVGESVMRDYTVSKHPQAGAEYLQSKFLSEFTKHRQDFEKKGVNEFFLSTVCNIIKSHHGSPEMSWHKLLKEADWDARAEEADKMAGHTIDRSELSSLYKDCYGDVSELSKDELKNEVVRAYTKLMRESIESILRSPVSIAQFFNVKLLNVKEKDGSVKKKKVLVNFCGQGEDGELYVYFDPEKLFEYLSSVSKTLSAHLSVLRNGSYPQKKELKILVASALLENHLALVKSGYYSVSAGLIDSEQLLKKHIEAVYVNNSPANFRTLPCVLPFRDAGEARRFSEILASYTKNNSKDLYIGKLKLRLDDGEKKEVIHYVPLKPKK